MDWLHFLVLCGVRSLMRILRSLACIRVLAALCLFVVARLIVVGVATWFPPTNCLKIRGVTAFLAVYT